MMELGSVFSLSFQLQSPRMDSDLGVDVSLGLSAGLRPTVDNDL